MKLFNPSLIVGMILLLMAGCLGGCFGGKTESKSAESKGGGFQAKLPKVGTRVVVWGNHAAAIDQTSFWFHQNGFVMIDRTRLQQGFKSQSSRLSGSSRDWFKILEAGNRIGAEMVTFVEVTNIQDGRKFALRDVDKSEDFRMNVEVRTIQADNGEIISKGNASQIVKEDDDPQNVIENLTLQALQWAWAEREISPPPLAPAQKPDPGDLEGRPPQDSTKGKLAQTDNEPIVFVGSAAETGQDSSQVKPIARSDTIEKSEWGENNNQEKCWRPNEGEEDCVPVFDPRISDGPYSQEPGIGLHLAGGALSILYFPVKLIYAGLGGVVGGAAYVMAGRNEEVVDSIWEASTGGTYFITAAHLQGDEPVYFKGIPEKEVSTRQNSQDSILVQSSVPPVQ